MRVRLRVPSWTFVSLVVYEFTMTLIRLLATACEISFIVS
jgi:hypothetical protein